MNNYKLLDFKKIGFQDVGYLTPLEGQKDIPFEIKRVYYIYDVPNDVKRGFHAHKKLEQVLVCVNGSVTIHVEDAKTKEKFVLDDPHKGLYIGPRVWREMTDFYPNSVFLAIVSRPYEEEDYIRDYKEFEAKYKNHDSK